MSHEYLTRTQVAELFQIAPKSLSAAVGRGLVPAGTRIAGIGLRWQRAEVEKFIAGQFKRPEPAKARRRPPRLSSRLPGEGNEAAIPDPGPDPVLAREADAVFAGGR